MKKIIQLVLCFLFVFSFTVCVYGEERHIEEDGLTIYYEDEILVLNNYSYSGTGVDLSTYAIYTDEDLTIKLIGNNSISNDSDGICIGGNLKVIGDGILNLYTLEVDGLLTIESGSINLLDGTDSYIGNKPNYPYYAYYNDGSNKYSLFDISDNEFKDITGLNEVNTTITLKGKELVNLDKLNITNPLFFNNPSTGNEEEIENVNGFVVIKPELKKVATYDGIDTYTLDIWGSFNSDGYSNNFIEFAYDESELGKVVEFEVLSANNFYILDESLNKQVINVGDLIKEEDEYVGSASYASISSGSEDIKSTYLNLFAKQDNSISLKMLGANGTYKYINVSVKKKDNPTPTPTPKKEDKSKYTIPNTGVK